MKIYSIQDYSINAAILEAFTGHIWGNGLLSPQFSTFSGVTDRNVCSRFNLCLLDKDTPFDGEFRRDFPAYLEQCRIKGICSFVFFHPDNGELCRYLQLREPAITARYIPTEDLSSAFLTGWLEKNYLHGMLPDLLDYFYNRPVLKLIRSSCLLCGKIMTVPAGVFFESIQSAKNDHAYPIERFLPVDRFTDNIGGYVYYFQLLSGKFRMYEPDCTDYAHPETCTCPDCGTRVKLPPINPQLLAVCPQSDIAIPPMRLTDEDLAAIRDSGFPQSPHTGAWSTPNIPMPEAVCPIRTNH